MKYIKDNMYLGFEDPDNFEYLYGGASHGEFLKSDLNEFGDIVKCKDNEEFVPGYKKKDGTWVKGYCRKR